MVRIFHCGIYLILVYLVGGCASVRVNSDYDPTADFSAIHTYSWRKVNVPGDALETNPLLYKRIETVVDKYLLDRGYQKTDQDSADILVTIHAGVKEKMRVTDWGGPRGYYRYPWYDPWWGSGIYGGRIDVSYYTEGTLIIDIIDRKRKELIWRGVGTGIVHQYSGEEKTMATINEYVGEILDRFPPGNKKQ